MYGASALSYGSEAVVSFNNLIEAIKRRQLLPQLRIFGA